MNRVLLDTNIYGTILQTGKSEKLAERLAGKDISVVGFDLIRKELRHTSKNTSIGGKNLRIELLKLYDTLTRGRTCETTPTVTDIAKTYFDTLANLGSKNQRDEVFNDLLIVACASVNEVDIVVSDDKKTMFSAEFLTAYKIVNNIRRLRMPAFIGYEKFTRSSSL